MEVKDGKIKITKTKIEAEKVRRKLTGFPRILAYILGVSLTIVIFYTAFFGAFLTKIQAHIYTCLILSLIFLWYPRKKGDIENNKNDPELLDYVVVLFCLFALYWTTTNNLRFESRMRFFSDVSNIDIFVGVTLILVILEAGRRTLGWIITFITMIFLAYIFLGPYMPIFLKHNALIGIKDFVDEMYLSDEGISNPITGIMATIMFAFVAFGTFLAATNVDQKFMDLALSLGGKYTGGPAKVAVISSAAMGMISGSTLANVMTTGKLTIPLMKRTGWEPHEAGAIETAASCAGQVMPPVMGSAAFLMANFLAIKYLEIVKVSFIPAFLYYISLFLQVHLRAKAKGLKGIPASECPRFIESLKRSLLPLLPIVVLLVMLLKNFTPFMSASVCTSLIVLLSYINKESRMGIKKFLSALEECSITMTTISGVTLCAAVVVGAINGTGLVVKTTALILYISKGSLVGTIIVEAIIAYILGMGMPNCTCYILLSILGAPALIELGVIPLAAHLLIFWFIQLAEFTPPICITAFAAASIAKANPIKTGFTALRFGLLFYLIPLLFVYTNILSNFWSGCIIMILSLFSYVFLYIFTENYDFGLNIVNKGWIPRCGFLLIFIIFSLLIFSIF